MKKLLITLFTICLFNLAFGQRANIDSLYIYEVADTRPEPIGGQKAVYSWIADNIKTEILTDTLDCDSFRGGRVMISYTINEEGKLIDPEIEYGLGEPYDSEALRLITQMPIDWTPGTKNGQTVKVRSTSPIFFCNKRQIKD